MPLFEKFLPKIHTFVVFVKKIDFRDMLNPSFGGRWRIQFYIKGSAVAQEGFGRFHFLFPLIVFFLLLFFFAHDKGEGSNSRNLTDVCSSNIRAYIKAQTFLALLKNRELLCLYSRSYSQKAYFSFFNYYSPCNFRKPGQYSPKIFSINSVMSLNQEM